MWKMKLMLGAAWVLFMSEPVTAQVSAPQLWKARALEAADKLKTLESKIDRLRGSWQSPEANALKCEVMLESAFILHLTEEAIVHKVLDGGHHGFKIILNGGDQGVFDLMYVYDSRTWQLTAASMFSLPKAWQLIFFAGTSPEVRGFILLIQGEQAAAPMCSMAFSPDKPFWAHALPAEPLTPTPPPPKKGSRRR